MKICPVGIELFHADGRKDKHDEANSCFSQILRTRLKTATTKSRCYITVPCGLAAYLLHIKFSIKWGRRRQAWASKRCIVYLTI
jgi:hypothetical protein